MAEALNACCRSGLDIIHMAMVNAGSTIPLLTPWTCPVCLAVWVWNDWTGKWSLK